jgi:hypothetical protein
VGETILPLLSLRGTKQSRQNKSLFLIRKTFVKQLSCYLDCFVPRNDRQRLTHYVLRNIRSPSLPEAKPQIQTLRPRGAIASPAVIAEYEAISPVSSLQGAVFRDEAIQAKQIPFPCP